MSSSKAKKERQQDKESGVVNKRAAEALERQQNKKKTRKLVILVVAIIVVLLAIAIVLNSKFIRRNYTALTIGDMEFSVTEYEFFYYNCYYEYYSYIYSSEMATYATELLPEMGVPHASQTYKEDTGETWKDFFDDYTYNTLTRYVGIYNKAQAAGFVFPEEEEAALQEEIEGLAETAMMYGYTDVEDYIRAMYGNSITLEIMEECMKFRYYVISYEEYYNESLVYTDEEIDAQYLAEQDKYDLYEYRYFLVSGEDVDKYAYETEEEAEAAQQDSQAAAHAIAEGYIERINSEIDFVAIAKEHNGEDYAEEDSTLRRYNGSLLGSVYGDWLRDPARKYGDITLADMETGTYVVFFIAREDNHYETVDARMIAVGCDEIDTEEYEDDEDDTAYNEAVATEKEETGAEAEDILQQWKDEGGTAELFDEYIEYYYQNFGHQGGYEENIYRDKYSKEIDAWLYDPARVEGDTTIIFSENMNAYYIIYYCGPGAIYAEDMAEDDLRQDDLDVWEASLIDGIEITKTWLFALEKAGTQLTGWAI